MPFLASICAGDRLIDFRHGIASKPTGTRAPFGLQKRYILVVLLKLAVSLHDANVLKHLASPVSIAVQGATPAALAQKSNSSST
jgi:hypothetical protein